jgi:restriction endonuclease S subunit
MLYLQKQRSMFLKLLCFADLRFQCLLNDQLGGCAFPSACPHISLLKIFNAIPEKWNGVSTPNILRSEFLLMPIQYNPYEIQI